MTQGLSLLDQCGDVHKWMAGWDHQMAGGHVFCSAQDRAAGEHSHFRRTEFRLPRTYVWHDLNLGGVKCMPKTARVSSPDVRRAELDAILGG